MIHFSLMHQDELKYRLNKTDSAGLFRVPPSHRVPHIPNKGGGRAGWTDVDTDRREGVFTLSMCCLIHF